MREVTRDMGRDGARGVRYDRSRVIRYLAWTFGLAYLIQIGAAYIINHGHLQIGQLIVAAMMFVPALGVVLAGAGARGEAWESYGTSLKDMGWKPGIRKNIGRFLTAWFLPMILTVTGAAIYFLIFPGHIDLSGDYLVSSVGAQALEQMKAQGLTYPMYVVITAVGSITYAPLINMVVALGEEIGWRGFLYPQLKARLGRRSGRVLGGVIWGAWHWPLIWLIGYEYGAAAGNAAGYAGFPVTGMLLFCVVTVAWGVLHDWLYERSGTIWVPAIFHGAINAAATLPLAVCIVNTGSTRLLGPAPNGLIAALPFLILAVVVLVKDEGV